MTIDEKIGQLFIHLTGNVKEEEVREEVWRKHMGGIRFNPLEKESMWEMNYNFQKCSKIPVLSAVNAEMGGNGATKDGTFVGSEMKIAATGDSRYAYELGRIAGLETNAIGSNCTFAPIVDLVRNWHHPGIATRSWGNDPDLIIEMSKAYFKGMQESGIACVIKHFPGDCCDERDPHVATSVNNLSCKEWDNSYGKVYSELISEGIQGIMTGHIMMPAYQRYFYKKNTGKDLEDKNLLPATLSHEILTDLLRGKLGFNGVLVSDASHMVGLTGRGKRRELVPGAIMAGIDMFLFFNDIEEDFAFMKEAYLDGRLTEERMSDALHRILGLKAVVGLANFTLDKFPSKEGLSVIGKHENTVIASEIADKGITLVKSTEKLFPIDPKEKKRVLLVSVGPHPNQFLVKAGMAVDGSDLIERFKAKLDEKGFSVEVYVDPLSNMMKMIEQMGPDAIKLINKKGPGNKGLYGMKKKVSDLTDNYDLVICFANVTGTMKTTQRLEWALSKGGWDNPWYVNEIPTMFVSFNCPFHLPDVSQVKNYINCYDSHDFTLQALVNKMVGESEFKGQSPVDAFCGFIDTRF
jgi:beta-N-acetylhexosaminidase